MIFLAGQNAFAGSFGNIWSGVLFISARFDVVSIIYNDIATPIVVVIGAALIFKEKVSPVRWVAVSLAYSGF